MLYDKSSLLQKTTQSKTAEREVIMSRYTKNDIFRMVEEEDVH